MAISPKLVDCDTSQSEACTEFEDTKLKILCIHGYCQSADMFKKKLGAFRKALKKHATFYFVSAPNVIPPSDKRFETRESGDTSDTECYGWWFSGEDMSFDSRKDTDVCIGFQKSWNQIAKLAREEGPFDGLMGFSQGASMVGVFCGMQQQHFLDFNFRFAILVAGFKSHSLQHRAYYTDMIELPTLHVFGDSDQVIGKEMSEELTTYFKNPTIVQHAGGHFVPATEKEKTFYIKFLEERLKNNEEENNEEETSSNSVLDSD